MARKKKDQDAKLTDRFKVWMTVSDFAGAVEPRGRKEQDIAALCLPPGSRHSLHSASAGLRPGRCGKHGKRFAAPVERSPRWIRGAAFSVGPCSPPRPTGPGAHCGGTRVEDKEQERYPALWAANTSLPPPSLREGARLPWWKGLKPSFRSKGENHGQHFQRFSD